MYRNTHPLLGLDNRNDRVGVVCIVVQSSGPCWEDRGNLWKWFLRLVWVSLKDIFWWYCGGGRGILVLVLDFGCWVLSLISYYLILNGLLRCHSQWMRGLINFAIPALLYWGGNLKLILFQLFEGGKLFQRRPFLWGWGGRRESWRKGDFLGFLDALPSG